MAASFVLPAARGGKITKAGGGLVVKTLLGPYQGGSSYTIFSAQGSNPVSNCKVCGKGVQKVYDRSVKGYVYCCGGGPSSKLQFPKDDSKAGLQLVQPYLVLQIFVPQAQHFSLELRVSDTTNTRRKMYLSTSFSELKATPLHCQIPISVVIRNKWLSLAIHVADLFLHCFRVNSFRCIDVIVLGPVCKIRKIFTMRNCLAETPDALKGEEGLPHDHMFSSAVDASIQVIDSAMLQYSLGLVCSSDGGRTGADNGRKTNKTERSPQVAFGSRVPLPLSTVQINTNLPNDGNTECIKERHVEAPIVHGKFSKSSNHKSLESQEGYAGSFEVKTPVSENKLVGSMTPVSYHESILSEEVQEIGSLGKQARQAPSEDKVRVCITPIKFCGSSKQEGLPTEERESEKPAADKNRAVEIRNHGLQKSQKLNKKKEEPPVLTDMKSLKKDTNKTKEFEHTRYMDSPPGSPPCGWEGCSSSGASDDMRFSQGFSSFNRVCKSSQSIELANVASTENEIPDRLEYGDATWQGNMPQSGKSGAGLTVQQLSSLHFLKRKHGRGFANLPTAGGLNHRYDVETNNLEEDLDFQFNSDEDLSEVQSIGSEGSGATAHLRASLDRSRNLVEEVNHPVKDLERRFPSVETHCQTKPYPQEGEQVIHDPYEEEFWVVHEEIVTAECKDPASEALLDDSGGKEMDVKVISKLDEDTTENQVLVTSFGCFPSAKRETFDFGSVINDSPRINSMLSGGNLSKSVEEPCKVITPSKFEATIIEKQSNGSNRGADEDLDLLYDPTLDCYYDPKTNRYYELQDTCM